MICLCQEDQTATPYCFSSRLTAEEMEVLERLRAEEQKYQEELIKQRIKRAEENRRRKDSKRREKEKVIHEQLDREREAHRRQEHEEQERKRQEEEVARAAREELRLRREKGQDARSAAFANAASGKTDLVILAIKEHNVKPGGFEGAGEVRRKNFAEETLLHIAARTGNARLVSFLIESGAEASQLNAIGRAPLHDAATAKKDSLAVITALVEGSGRVDVNLKAIDNNETALHVAAECGNAEAAQYLISKGANVHLRDSFGSIPLVHLQKFLGEKAPAVISPLSPENVLLRNPFF